MAYATLARRDRKARHLAAARYFEALGTEELAGALAAHYLAAYRNAPEGPEADALAAQARITLRAPPRGPPPWAPTTRRSRSSSRPSESQRTRPSRPAFSSAPADSASRGGHHDGAGRYLRRAIEIHRGLGDRSATARATAALGRALITPV